MSYEPIVFFDDNVVEIKENTYSHNLQIEVNFSASGWWNFGVNIFTAAAIINRSSYKHTLRDLKLPTLQCELKDEHFAGIYHWVTGGNSRWLHNPDFEFVWQDINNYRDTPVRLPNYNLVRYTEELKLKAEEFVEINFDDFKEFAPRMFEAFDAELKEFVATHQDKEFIQFTDLMDLMEYWKQGFDEDYWCYLSSVADNAFDKAIEKYEDEVECYVLISDKQSPLDKSLFCGMEID